MYDKRVGNTPRALPNKDGRRDCPDFEPQPQVITPFVRPFLKAPERHLLAANRILRETSLR